MPKLAEGPPTFVRLLCPERIFLVGFKAWRGFEFPDFP
jgi:hypothetical protein